MSANDARLAPNAAPTQWHDDPPHTPLSAWVVRTFALRAWPDSTPDARGGKRRPCEAQCNQRPDR